MRRLVAAGRSARSRRSARAWAQVQLGLVVAAALLASCGAGAPRAEGLEVALSFAPTPRVGPTTCTVELVGPEGAPLEGAELEVEGNMNHAGMVPVLASATEVEPGTYEAPFEFTMGGDWFVIVRGNLADGRTVDEVVDVPGVASRRASTTGGPR
ncbi:MAG: FixH family protein [Planctomycetes bacterium]|nr:FixH family protein [Planctomycetota bacterium]